MNVRNYEARLRMRTIYVPYFVVGHVSESLLSDAPYSQFQLAEVCSTPEKHGSLWLKVQPHVRALAALACPVPEAAPERLSPKSDPPYNLEGGGG